MLSASAENKPEFAQVPIARPGCCLASCATDLFDFFSEATSRSFEEPYTLVVRIMLVCTLFLLSGVSYAQCMGSGCQAQDDKVTLLQRGTVASNDRKAEWEWNAPLDSKYKGICDGCMIYNSFNPRTKWCDTATEADGSGSNGCQDRKKVGEACGQDYECVSQSCSPELKTCESRCSPTDAA